ncbi:MAG TPA: hypothetical protein VLL75_11115, partial [Vicinamibacteria bacterium]|nr:hypothetical protein [Vicinamibacteria bacterium]
MTSRLAALLVALAATSAPAGSREPAVREIDRVVSLAPGRSVRVSSEHGDVAIRAGERPEVAVHAEIWVSAATRAEAERYAGQVRVELQEDAEGVSLRTVAPDPGQEPGAPSFSVVYDLTVPKAAPVSVRSRFGDVTATGLDSRVEIVNSHGRIGLSDTRGEGRLQNEFGIVEAERASGALSIESTNGPVTVTEVGGALTVSNRFSDVTVRQARAAVSLTVSNANVTVSEAAGPVRITDSFCLVLVSTVAGDLTFDNRNGRVEARGIGGKLTVTSVQGEVTFAEVAGVAVASA